ncbi:MAG: type II toxin-antitoxin system VapC family toxin [Luteolibacter sp.]
MIEGSKVLVDTNVWIRFLREPLPELALLVKRGRVITHPCVVGEVLVGNVGNRQVIREFFLSLPLAREADLGSLLGMIETRQLYGRGLQWNDIQLLAAAKLSFAQLWTHDQQLADAARELGLGWG